MIFRRNKKPASKATAAAILALLLAQFAAHALVTPAQYLQSQIHPTFKAGHRLPPLAKFWPDLVNYDSTAFYEFSRFGYCIYINGYLSAAGASSELANPASDLSRKVKLYLSDPNRYSLCVAVSKDYVDSSVSAAVDIGTLADYQRQVGLMAPETYLRYANGDTILGEAYYWRKPCMLWSPEGHTAWQTMAHQRAEGLRRLKAAGVNRIEIIMNSGEYGSRTDAYDSVSLARDPRVVAARGSMPWQTYLDKAWAKLEGYITDSVNVVYPKTNRGQYVKYCNSPRIDRGARWRGTDNGAWGPGWPEGMNNSDLFNTELYPWFSWGAAGFEYTPGWTAIGTPKWKGWDMCRIALNATSQSIAVGKPLGYHWLAVTLSDQPGWIPANTYMGWAKFLYTQGMIGAVVQDYSSNSQFNPQHPEASFDPANPPSWLRGMVAHGQVHALFSHLDDFLFDGDLLPGPNVHDFSLDMPGYEFPASDINIHVLARKKKSAEEWIVTAFLGTNDISNTTIASKKSHVTIPGIGVMTVNARSCGSVYLVKRINGVMSMKLLDPDPANPSAIPGDVFFVATSAESLPIVAWDGVVPKITMNTSSLELYENQGKGINADKGYPLAVPPCYSAWAPTSPGFELVLDTITNVPLTINYQVIGGTATENVDYDSLAHSVTIPAGSDHAYILVTPREDNITEPTETITIKLLDDNRYASLTATATTSIYNTIPQISATRPVAGTAAPLSFSVTRNASQLRISLSSGIRTLKLYNVAGRQVGSFAIEKNQHQVIVPRSAMASGPMIIRAVGESGKERMTKMVVVP